MDALVLLHKQMQLFLFEGLKQQDDLFVSVVCVHSPSAAGKEVLIRSQQFFLSPNNH